MWEWANTAQFQTASAPAIAGAATSVIQALHAQDANRDVIFGTSIDRGDAFGTAHYDDRDAYNAYWNTVANQTGIAAYVPLHLDPNVGQRAVARIGGTANAWYQGDDLHLTAAGYALVGAGPHGFRSAVQAWLAAA